MHKALYAMALAGGILAMTVGQAFAFDCTVANKPTGAGSAVTVNIDTGDVTPNKSNPGTETQVNGGFVTLTGTAPDGSTVSADVFAHAPANAQAPFAEPDVVPGATKQTDQGRGCDGKGLDTLDTCFGG